MSPQVWPPAPKTTVQGQVPANVAVGSGSFTRLLDGTVLVAGASRVRLDALFDGLAADLYELHWRFSVATASYLQLRFAAAGTPYSGSSYVRDVAYAAPGAGFSSTADTQTALIIGSGATSAQHGRLELAFPALAGQAATYFGQYSAAAASKNLVTGYMTVNTVFDGIEISNSGGGAMSGFVKVIKLG